MSPELQTSPSQHQQQAEHNEQLARCLVADEPAWSTTIAFYAALHYVAEYACMRREELYSHPETERYIQRTKELRPIGRDYASLYQYSRRARYYCPGPNDQVNTPSFVSTLLSRVGYIHSHIAKQKAKLPKP